MLNSVDLEYPKLVSTEEKMVRDTTITLPKALHKQVKKVAEDRGRSMNINIMVSTAIAHWLATKGALKVQ